jgi:hypothetical protein
MYPIGNRIFVAGIWLSAGASVNAAGDPAHPANNDEISSIDRMVSFDFIQDIPLY